MNAISASASLLLALTVLEPLAAQPGRYANEVFEFVDVQTDIAYGSAFNDATGVQETLLLDLYRPLGDTETSRPAVVLAHEGGFLIGDKSQVEFAVIGKDLASRGYVAVSINYRLGVEPVTPAIVNAASHDVLAAVRWLRSQESALGIDVDRIACFGASAGGVASMTSQYDNDLGEGSSGNPGFSSDAQAVVELWAAFSSFELDPGEVPFAIVHGTADQLVPFQFALDLSAKAALVGIPSELHTVQGGPHSAWDFYLPTYHLEVVGFLYEQLELGALAGLSAQPGFASPGSVTFESFGTAGDTVALLLGTASGSLPIPGFGTLCIGPVDSLVSVGLSTLPAQPRLSDTAFSLSLPAGLGGMTFHWQALQLEPGGLGLLTNCVQTTL
ncbi:MAG: alpha/beta hydrolase [Planctomycetota bacterium]